VHAFHQMPGRMSSRDLFDGMGNIFFGPRPHFSPSKSAQFDHRPSHRVSSHCSILAVLFRRRNGKNALGISPTPPVLPAHERFAGKWGATIFLFAFRDNARFTGIFSAGGLRIAYRPAARKADFRSFLIHRHRGPITTFIRNRFISNQRPRRLVGGKSIPHRERIV